jgi:hypothetical protein
MTDHMDISAPTGAAEAADEVRTAAATAARIRGKHDRWAAEMEAAGWRVIPPHSCPDCPEHRVERHTFARPCPVDFHGDPAGCTAKCYTDAGLTP